jgi:hypothetical protein
VQDIILAVNRRINKGFNFDDNFSNVVLQPEAAKRIV